MGRPKGSFGKQPNRFMNHLEVATASFDYLNDISYIDLISKYMGTKTH